MAKARARRLKVFEAQFGFYDSIVAAASQKAALEAWGVRQNLFAEGGARVAKDETAIAAALRHPETPLRRAAGSDAPFSLTPDLPDAPDVPRKAGKTKVEGTKRSTPSRPETAEAKKPEPPDRSALDAAEARLRTIDARRDEDEAAFARRQAALDAEAEAARQRWREDRRAAKAALDEARRVWRKAGGR